MGTGGLPGGMPANFYPQMAAFAAAQENAAAMVAVAKLGISKPFPATNSYLVVRGSVRKFNMNGVLFSVGEWIRKTVEENLEWLVKLSRRHSGGDRVVLLAYGDGCETLVLLDDKVDKMPHDFSKIKKIGVGVTMTDVDSTLDESKLAAQGVLQPSDSIWEHLRFETMASGDNKIDKCLFIHTNMTVWSEGIDSRRRVLQVATGSGLSYQPNALFEQQVLLKWKGLSPLLPMPKALTMAPSDSEEEDEEEENVTVITFNPKELILLEKAFDNRMTSRDRKTNVNKYNDEDRKACQHVIRRAQNEFVMRGPPRKRKKKSEEDLKEEDSNEAKQSEPAVEEEIQASPPKAKAEPTIKETKVSPSKKSKTPEVKPTPKSSKKAKKENGKSTKKENDKNVKKDQDKNVKKDDDKKVKNEDDDDEPISKMVQKADSAPVVKKARRSFTSNAKENVPKPTPKMESRGRSKVSSNEKAKESVSHRKRSKSRGKK